MLINDSEKTARLVRLSTRQVKLNGSISAALGLEMIAHIRELETKNKQLRAALKSIADQTKCQCYHSDTGNKYERHSSYCYWYIHEEALEALEVKDE